MTRFGLTRATLNLTVAVGVLAAASMLASTGCSTENSKNTSNSTETTYQGTIVGPMGESGFLEVTVTETASAASSAGMMKASAAAKQASGRMKLDSGCEDQLTGTLDGAALDLSGTGACGNYTLSGTLAAGRVDGTFTAATGHTGSFVVEESSAGSSVTVFCGRWTETASGVPTGKEGPWNMVVSSSGLTGVAFDANGATIPLGGSLSGDHVTVLYTPNQQQIAQGDISGTQISGTYDIGTSAGSWAGQVCQ